MSENALQRIEPMPVAPSVEAMITLAIERGATVETIERLMAVRREVRAEQAKEAYDRALAEFQAECPTIQKTAKVMNKDGRTVRYQYAPLDAIIHQVKGLLQKHGFSYSVNAKAELTQVTAVCKLTHSYGHSESSEFAVPIDKDAFMNPAQQVASALTFAKRYAFCNACGIMTGDADDDSQASHGEKDKPGNANAGTPRGTATKGAKGATEQQPKPAQATEKTRAWFLSEMRKAFDDKVLLQWGVDHINPAYLLPHEHLEDWPLAHVPTSKAALEAKVRECAEFMGIEPKTPQEAPGASARPPSTSADHKQNAPETARRSKEGQSEPDHHSAEWYNFPMPWGKKAGTILGKLEKNYLYGLWKNFTVETTYNGKPKKKETIATDRAFRVMLDMAGVHYKFDEPKGGDQDSNMGSDPTGGDYDDPPY